MGEHEYHVQVTWSGNDGEGTRTYAGYRRDHTITAGGKPVLAGSSDPRYRGDGSRYNPEELLLASVSACHMLWYLHLCADASVVVTVYQDDPVGVVRMNPDGSGAFTKVKLRPHVILTSDSDAERARTLHEQAHHFCLIAASVSFPIEIEPAIERLPIAD